MVDYIPERLELAKSIGAIPIDFTLSDPVAMIEALRSQHARMDTLLPGERKLQKIVSGVKNLVRSAGASFEVARSDPVTMIEMLRTGNPAIVQSLLPGEEKK